MDILVRPERRTPTRAPTVLDAVRAHARSDSGIPAFVDGTRQVGYPELMADVDHLARALRGCGVHPGDRIGVVVDRSIETLTLLLATWQAGAAYVPLDPRYPAARLRDMVTGAGARTVIGRYAAFEAAGGHLPTDMDVEFVRLGAGAFRRHDQAPADPAGPGRAELAYLMFTSGSTGRPKGVLVSHEALAVAADSLRTYTGIAAGDRILSFASLSWDTSGEELCTALLAGATLVIDPRVENGSIPSFLTAVRERAVSVVDLPTGFFNEVVDFLSMTGEPLPDSLRLVITGGEEVRPHAVRAWSHLADDRVRLINTYGQTETVLVTHAADVGGAAGRQLGDTDRVPIGPPLPHVRQHLDGAELLIGGPTLAWGYLGAAGATAARFEPSAGGRVYRTGDLVRERPDGALEFVGRADRQIKIRGYRVEPEEVERVLLSCAGIRAAVALPVTTLSGDALWAGYVPDAEAPPADRDVAEWLAGRLPHFMIPQRTVRLAGVPLHANGKVDYAMTRSHMQEAVEGATDAPPAAETVAELMSEVLGRPAGPDDDFFDLGGDSLRATRLISRIYRRFDVELTFADVFEGRTAVSLGAIVDTTARRRPVG